MQVESWGGFLESYCHLALRGNRSCMVGSSCVGEVRERLFYNLMVLSCYGGVVFAWLSRRMQVKSREAFL